jgi:hypothetical protein
LLRRGSLKDKIRTEELQIKKGGGSAVQQKRLQTKKAIIADNLIKKCELRNNNKENRTN